MGRPAAKNKKKGLSLWTKMFLLGLFCGLIAGLYCFARRLGEQYSHERSLTHAARLALTTAKNGATQTVTDAVKLGMNKIDPPSAPAPARDPAKMTRAELQQEVTRLDEIVAAKDRELDELKIQLKLQQEGSKAP